MAKTKGPLLSQKAKGTVGKVITFLDRCDSHAVQKIPTHKDAKTQAQLVQRSYFQGGIECWHTLTDEEKAEYASIDPWIGANPGYLNFLKRWLMGVVPIHHTRHEDGGADEVNVAGLSGELADGQTPKAHTHAGGDITSAVDDSDHLEGATKAQVQDHAPKAHDLAGAEHNADTLADLNLKISDATLDDQGASRTPTAHKTSHQDGGTDEINVAALSGELADEQKSAWAKVSGKPGTFPPSAHKASHQDAGDDELTVAGLSGELADNQPPKAHATSHKTGGSDILYVPRTYVWYIPGNLTTGTEKGPTFRMKRAAIVEDVELHVKTAPVGAAIIIDINEAGTTLFSTRPEIDAGTTTEDDNHAFSDTALAAASELTMDIDQVGSTTPGADLTVLLHCKEPVI